MEVFDAEIVLGQAGQAVLAVGKPDFSSDGSHLVRIPPRVSAGGLEVRSVVELEWAIGPGLPGLCG